MVLTTLMASAPGVPGHQRHARDIGQHRRQLGRQREAGSGGGSRPTMRRTHSGSAPNSMPPALVLGQDRLSSNPAMPGTPSSPADDLGVLLDGEARPR